MDTMYEIVSNIQLCKDQAQLRLCGSRCMHVCPDELPFLYRLIVTFPKQLVQLGSSILFLKDRHVRSQIQNPLPETLDPQTIDPQTLDPQTLDPQKTTISD